MIVIGIDPGITGAIAVLVDYSEPIGREVRNVYDMPIMAKSNGKGNQINSAALADILSIFSGESK